MKQSNYDALKIVKNRHSLHVAALVKQILLWFRYTDAEALFLASSAAFHDVGKAFIPSEILDKPGRLTEREFDIIKEHVDRGVEYIDEVFGSSKPELRNMVAMHHERADGRGYPHGLTIGEIPFEAQVAAIADVYDALCSKRSYKDGIDPAEALDMIVEGRCGAFSQRLLNCVQEPEMQIVLALIEKSSKICDQELLEAIDDLIEEAATS